MFHVFFFFFSKTCFMMFRFQVSSWWWWWWWWQWWLAVCSQRSTLPLCVDVVQAIAVQVLNVMTGVCLSDDLNFFLHILCLYLLFFWCSLIVLTPWIGHIIHRHVYFSVYIHTDRQTDRQTYGHTDIHYIALHCIPMHSIALHCVAVCYSAYVHSCPPHI